MSFANVLTILVIVIAVPLNWYVWWRLRHIEQLSDARHSAHERALTALAVAIIVTVFALTFLNNDLITPTLTFEETKIVTRSVILVFSVAPAIYWLRLYR